MKYLKSVAPIVSALALLLHSWLALADVSGSENIALIINNRENSIAGTLALPRDAQTDTLVIMLSGSGPQDRDETLNGFKVFFHLATHLSEQGIPSFRYDDRGVGGSTGNFGQSTLADHSNDVIQIMDYFTNHDVNRFERFILLGHSQGGIVATDVAITRPDVEKVILMAAPTVPLIDIVLYQVRQRYAQLQIDNALIERGVSAHNHLMWAIQSSKAQDVALKNFEKTILDVLAASPENHSTPLSDLKRQASEETQEFRIVYALPSLTSFLYHDPALNLKDVKVPVLGLFGGKDLQVTIQQTKDVMEQALLKSGVAFTLVTFDNANHHFQLADKGGREEYAILEKKFVPNFLQKITDWIKNVD